MEETWFENGKPLNRRFEIYLPSKDKCGNPVDELEIVFASTTGMLCDRFGGVTSFPASGRFQRTSGTSQTEDIIVLESFCDAETWDRNSRFLRVWVSVLTALLRQESIACALDGRMIFVPPIPLPDSPTDQIAPDTLPGLVARILDAP